MVNRGVSSTDDSDSEDELSESEAPKNLDMLSCESQIKETINKKITPYTIHKSHDFTLLFIT